MQKHVAFWLGAFSASITVVSIAIGAWSVASDRALNFVAMAVGAILAVTIFLYVIFWLRRRLLAGVLGVSKASLEDVAEHASDAVYAIGAGDRQAAKTSTSRVAGTFLGWWVWSNFYRWVISTNIALLIAFGGFVGTVLLFEQNKRLREQTNELIAQRKELQLQGERFDTQNELLGLNLTTDFRNRLKADDSVTLFLDVAFSIARKKCNFRVQAKKMSTVPNPSAVVAVSQLAGSKLLGEKVTNALLGLTEDSDQSVRLGALLALDRADKIPNGFSASFENVLLEGLRLNSSISLSIRNSFISNISCPKCDLLLSNSISGVSGSATVGIFGSLVVSDAYIGDGSLEANGDVSDASIGTLTLRDLEGPSLLNGEFLLPKKYYFADYLQSVSLKALSTALIGEGELVVNLATCKEVRSFVEQLPWITIKDDK